MPAILQRSLRSLLARIGPTAADRSGAEPSVELAAPATRRDLSLQALEAIHAGAVSAAQVRDWIQTLEAAGRRERDT